MTEVNRIDPVFKNAGDSGVIIEFGSTLDLSINRAVQLFDRKLSTVGISGVIDTVPTLRSVLVRFDPLQISLDELVAELKKLIHQSDWTSTTAENFKRWRIPVCYGGEYGEDLDEIAAWLKLSAEQVIEEHCQFVHTVLTLGFAPGFYYLGLMPDHWNLPRLQKIKPHVPAGSVSVAVCQTVVTSTPIPTGWRTIGRTPFSNFAVVSDPPVSVVSGDEVVFYSINKKEYEALSLAVQNGESIATATAIEPSA